ncbi:MAG TPA: carbohydrate ABC transporter permease [Clostridiaceae bacterium]|nr:carbohydrate ABC transporter permease [Clostridiaceae bacterium]
MKKSVTKKDKIFDLFLNLTMIIILVITLYPLYFVVIASISNPDLTYAGKVILFPKDITFAGFVILFEDGRIWRRYINTIIYTIVGTAVNLSVTLPASYALSRKCFKARKYINVFILFTMFFSGGLIPTYLLVKGLGLIDTMWAVILVSAVSVWNLIIARTYFAGNIPDELEESAFLDGCSHIKFFFYIALPLSKVIVIVLALFYGINHWNGYFNALIYLNTPEKFPLQLFLREILIQQQSMAMDPQLTQDMRYTANLVRYTMIIVATGPVLVIYPFLQRFFVKGVMIGAVKG